MKWLANERGANEDVSLTRNSEPTYYTKNKDGQYEIWPPQRTTRTRDWLIPTIAVILVIGAIFLIR